MTGARPQEYRRHAVPTPLLPPSRKNSCLRHCSFPVTAKTASWEPSAVYYPLRRRPADISLPERLGPFGPKKSSKLASCSRSTRKCRRKCRRQSASETKQEGKAKKSKGKQRNCKVQIISKIPKTKTKTKSKEGGRVGEAVEKVRRE